MSNKIRLRQHSLDHHLPARVSDTRQKIFRYRSGHSVGTEIKQVDFRLLLKRGKLARDAAAPAPSLMNVELLEINEIGQRIRKGPSQVVFGQVLDLEKKMGMSS